MLCCENPKTYPTPSQGFEITLYGININRIHTGTELSGWQDNISNPTPTAGDKVGNR
jgi:hypothetical protein